MSTEMTEATNERERRKAERHGETVAAALELVHERGMAGLSMRSLAEAMGYSTMAAYRHIGSRDGLVGDMIGHLLGDDFTNLSWVGVVRLAVDALAPYRGLADELPGVLAMADPNPNVRAWFDEVELLRAPDVPDYVALWIVRGGASIEDREERSLTMRKMMARLAP